MKTPHDYLVERREFAKDLEHFNNQACIQFAEILRTWDAYKRYSILAGEKIEELIPVAYFEAVYKLLSFAPEEDRFILMTGTPDAIEAIISRVQTDKGFYDEKGVWIEL